MILIFLYCQIYRNELLQLNFHSLLTIYFNGQFQLLSKCVNQLCITFIIKLEIQSDKYNMTQNRPVKLKTENLRTQCYFNGRVCQVQFGKPVKLPYIKKPNHPNNISRRSTDEKQFTKIQDKFYKQTFTNMNNISQLHHLTLQEIQLCQNRNRSLQKQKSKSKCLPKLINNQSKQFIQMTQGRFNRINSQKSITKIQFWQHVKDYKIGPTIGRGSYSIVKTVKGKDNKKYAVKIYDKSKLIDIDRKKNLERQIQILQNVSHPNLLKLYEVIYTEEQIYLVTELCENISLVEYMKNQSIQKIPEETIKHVMRQVFQSFMYLHKNDIVHRDVKMENILLQSNLTVKLIDFGFSIRLKNNELLHDFCGTPHYIAPQVIKKDGYSGKQADVWSLGVLLYRISVGKFPFKGMNQKVLYSKITKGEYQISNQISRDLMSLIQKILQKDWHKRIKIQQILQHKWFNS